MQFPKTIPIAIGTLKYLLLTATILPVSAHAQKPILINSTEQCWSGGRPGNRGCNYTFSIAFNKIRPQPDTLWIGDNPIELTEQREKPNTGGNVKVTTSRKRVQFDITGSTHFDDSRDRGRPHAFGEGPDMSKPKPPKKYKGVALLSYKYKGRQYYYEITRIMKKYPHQSYP